MLQIEKAQVHKLLCAQNPDAALLYLYLKSGGDPKQAAEKLGYSETRHACAGAILHQLGLWEGEKQVRLPGEQPQYTEEDVIHAMDTDMDFRSLRGEIQRLLGKNLTTEELKILIGFVRYLGMSADVIVLLVCYCKDRAKKLGKRTPSLRTIEKEAYEWAEKGIDTMEEAAAYTQQQNLRFSRVGRIMEILQIRGRNLTAPEKRYIKQWLEMGFEEDAIGLAYERSCINTGGLAWPYVHKILTSWHEQNLHTAQQVQGGERKPTVPKGASGELGDAELAAIRKLMKEG